MFKPDEVLFSPTMRCNLRCPHCTIEQQRKTLSVGVARRFLAECARVGIKRVGFTGGEPFLALDFLCAITEEALRRNMIFSRIMTNGAWFHTQEELGSALVRLHNTGYDGSFCVSVDAFHRQDLRKVAHFIRTAVDLWKRPDIVSLAVVKGARETRTKERLIRLSRLLNARLTRFPHKHASIRKNGLIFIRISYIDLSPVGKTARLKDPWDGKWFRDDFCRGPGNVFFVLPDGTVKPCCGYGNDAEILTIGSITRDTPQQLLRNAKNNRFISAVFSSGFHPIRQALERSGIRFPGKTTNHCFFCHYLTHAIPERLLHKPG